MGEGQGSDQLGDPHVSSGLSGHSLSLSLPPSLLSANLTAPLNSCPMAPSTPGLALNLGICLMVMSSGPLEFCWCLEYPGYPGEFIRIFFSYI